MSRYDLLIIGGGINGLGIAANASARGFSVLLVEKGDFGGGTTATSSRLIHGGLRYLQYGELGLVRESLRERGILARQRPHLVRPLQLLIPSFRRVPPPRWKLGVGLALYNYLARDPLFPAARPLHVSEVHAQEPGLTSDELLGGHVYPDAQLEFPERLCVELVRETQAAGGEARNYTRVTALRVRGDAVSGAALRDELTGEEWEVEAELILNAAGPWVDAVNRLLPNPPPRLIGGTWGTHLVLPAHPTGPKGALYAAARKDGRPFFLLPWDGRLLVGTTDVPFEGDPDRLQVQDWEVEYLLRETNFLFPGCGYTEADVEWTTIGVRPLPAPPDGKKRAAGAITRRHFLVEHAADGGVRRLASVVGGKLTTYRSLAEEAMEWVLRGEYPGPHQFPPPITEGLPVEALDRD
ncbi:MAG TPA: glycerol-3-phosphate dehydrogenase/oxidase, partial [Armatimonadota bacterium]|nr:glycerol-3-phosphate dehydrogenase/oxidase [Armatimonadota bacterium]